MIDDLVITVKPIDLDYSLNIVINFNNVNVENGLFYFIDAAKESNIEYPTNKYNLTNFDINNVNSLNVNDYQFSTNDFIYLKLELNNNYKCFLTFNNSLLTVEDCFSVQDNDYVENIITASVVKVDNSNEVVTPSVTPKIEVNDSLNSKIDYMSKNLEQLNITSLAIALCCAFMIVFKIISYLFRGNRR